MASEATKRLIARERRIGRALIAFMTLGFLALVVAVAAAAWVTVRNQQHTRWVDHTYEVELAIAELRRIVEQGETTRRGYMLAGEQNFLDAYRKTAADLPSTIARLSRLTADNPRQRSNIASLRISIAELLALRAHTNALVQQGRSDAAIAAFRHDVSVTRMRDLRRQLDTMGAEERRLLTIRDAQQKASVRTFYAILALAALVLVVVAVTSLLTILRYTQDLAASRNTLRSLNEHLEERVADRTADLSRANDEIQRFAYIVSHDLRSPLVNVMGFTAELETATAAITTLIDRAEAEAPDIVTEEARLAAREDLPEAIGFIRTSTQKMDRLINAILTLSRQGRRVLAPEPLDLAEIVDGIRGTLAHRLEDQEATIEIDGALPAITSDRLAIEQILSNLIENSVKYFQPCRPGRVVVSGARTGPRATIEIADNGRGIDQRDHQRIFDLFRRSGAQDQPGEGIGLAHVRALAYRLGGIVDVRSTLGEGATFRLMLPVTLELQEPAQ